MRAGKLDRRRRPASAKRCETLSSRHPLVCHGLSLSLGGVAPLDETFLQRVRRFLDQHGVPLYSEHLSYCSDDGHLYDLMPIPFTEEAVHHVAARIRQTQDILGRRIAVENVSYYATAGRHDQAALREIDFINAVLGEADCDLLLDVNNIYVNAINHRYDASEFLAALPGERVAYIHVAGHYDEADDLKVDTHGAAGQGRGLVAARRGLPPPRPAPDAARARLQLPAVCRTGRRAGHHPPDPRTRAAPAARRRAHG